MRLAVLVKSMTRPELEELIGELNCTEDEEMIIRYTAKGCSIVEISCRLNIATSTVSNRIRNIQTKIRRIRESEK